MLQLCRFLVMDNSDNWTPLHLSWPPPFICQAFIWYLLWVLWTQWWGKTTFKRHEHVKQIKRLPSAGEQCRRRNNARPGTRRQTRLLSYVGWRWMGSLTSSVRLSEGLGRRGVLGGGMGMHTHTSQARGWSDSSWSWLRGESRGRAVGVCGAFFEAGQTQSRDI